MVGIGNNEEVLLGSQTKHDFDFERNHYSVAPIPLEVGEFYNMISNPMIRTMYTGGSGGRVDVTKYEWQYIGQSDCEFRSLSKDESDKYCVFTASCRERTFSAFIPLSHVDKAILCKAAA